MSSKPFPRRTPHRPTSGLLVASALAALASTAMSAATTGVGIPERTRRLLVAGDGKDLDFWVVATAVRTYSVTGPLLWSLLRRRVPSPGLLVAAGLTQFGDAYLCLRSRNPVGAVGTGAFGLLHLVAARKVAS
ncbi:hypothetical protein [Umezawaea tangerina]|uniref:DoxX-like protein n=1 Tax=Umezawaea tangerina TaxID=84725 RepID=A0A2T0STX7_9PSEU|nr:hypothetical protein [Umezawaea tangerina]PRY36862.1 hypothetical protein CLV43_111234 [Umezawaea tangerina]